VGAQGPRNRGVRLEGIALEPALEKSGKIGAHLEVGQTVMVQVAKEAISTKGPRLTADISLAGRNVVLVPFSSKVFISQKIRSADEKKRLKRIAQGVLPKNFGVIIRTAAMNASDADVEHDIRSLVDKWHTALQNVKKSTAPALLLSEQNRANTIIRDSLDSSFSQITVDDETMFNEIRNYIRVIAPEKEKIVKLYRGKVPIFDNFDISKQIKSLFAKYVSLKRGAYLIIEHTEAMNVIDVNSGNRTKAEDDQEQTALDVNLAAAREIARQLRLRNIGGLVVVDFIDMRHRKDQQAVYKAMKDRLKRDKAKTQVLQITPIGLMEMTRQRLNESLRESVHDPCPYCGGRGRVKSVMTMSVEIQRQIYACIQKYRDTIGDMVIVVNSEVLSRFKNEDASLLMELERQHSGRLIFRGDHNQHRESFAIYDARYDNKPLYQSGQ